MLWLVLSSATGVVNKALSFVGRPGAQLVPGSPRGAAPAALCRRHCGDAATGGQYLGVGWWEWLSGPSVAMSASILMATLTPAYLSFILFGIIVVFAMVQRWLPRDKDSAR